MTKDTQKTPSYWFTTGQIAKHCHVTPETVANWIKRDQLKAGTTPGGHYRVTRQELVRFCREFGFEIRPEWEEEVKPPCVLMIDDEPEMISAVLPHLEKDGRLVLGADDVAEAGLLLMKHRPDVVILDLHLPGTDGIRIASLLRKEAELSGTRIVVLSGFIDNLVREAMKDLRVDHYINKPPNFEELSNIIDDLIEKSRS